MIAKQVRILLVNNHRLFREGLAAILNQVDGLEIVGGLSSGEELVNFFERYTVDLILMDIMMGGPINGLEVTRWLKENVPSVKVIIVTSQLNKDMVTLGIRYGIDGYLPKDAGKDVLIESIKSVTAGEKYFKEPITHLIFDDYYKKEKGSALKRSKTARTLTKREMEVLEKVADGKANREIAQMLGISIKTVETHKSHILAKLGLRNTAQLVKYAVKNEMVDPDE
jgi:DNA-binding NarL/FixJ family response regulator